ncbi:MAG: cytochrome b [Gammaproteobacteria bacterium]|nr:cytochrome b [Gammaproteobacteria bacterium]
MQFRNTTERYGFVARVFHWAMFLLIGLTTFLALNMETMSESDKAYTESLHRSLGVLIGVLLTLRFAWKLGNPQPADLPGPAWMAPAAHLLHWLLYAIMLLQVVAGIGMSQADGAEVGLFGLFTVPAVMAPDTQVEDFFLAIHEVNWIVLTVFVVGHVLAALHHHFADRGDVFERMGIGPPR